MSNTTKAYFIGGPEDQTKRLLYGVPAPTYATLTLDARVRVSLRPQDFPEALPVHHHLYHLRLLTSPEDGETIAVYLYAGPHGTS